MQQPFILGVEEAEQATYKYRECTHSKTHSSIWPCSMYEDYKSLFYIHVFYVFIAEVFEMYK